MAKLDGIKVVNETVEYNGFVYKKVDDKKREGDVLRALEDCNSDGFYEGEFFVVTKEGGQLGFNDNEDDHRWSGIHKYEFEVFRKSHAIANDKLTDAEGVVKIELPDGTKLEGTPSDLEKITRSMQKMQVEQVATVEMPEEAVGVEGEIESVPKRLQVGDYAKVITHDDNGQSEYGDIVKITEDDETDIPFNTDHLDGSNAGWHYEGNLVKATDKEVLEAKQALLKVNDYARVIGGEHTEHICGTHEFEIGTIVKLHEMDSDDDTFETRHLNGDEPETPWIHRKDLELLTKEETEHIAREAEEEKKAKAERAKWATIGREVGEIKKGDIVRTTSHTGSINPVGTIGVAREDGNADSCPTVALNGDTSNWSRVELIVPVERRFDTVG